MRRATLPILAHCVGAYKLWHDFVPHIPKTARYTLGSKIDMCFIDVIELLFSASYATRENKPPYLQKAIAHLDLVKFFLQICWEIKSLDNKKYIVLSERLDEIGKMLGGWLRQATLQKTPR